MKKIILITLLILSCTKSKHFQFTAKADQEERDVFCSLEKISYEKAKQDPEQFAYIFDIRKYNNPNKEYICEILDNILESSLTYNKNVIKEVSFMEILIEKIIEKEDKKSIAKLKKIIVDHESTKKCSLLTYACINHHLKLVELLVNSLEVDVNIVDSDNNETALESVFLRYSYTKREDINDEVVKKIVECLLSKGANVDYKNKSSYTALNIAIKNLPNDLSNILELLVDKISDINYDDYLFFAIYEYKIDHIRVLLDRGAIPNVYSVVGNLTTAKDIEMKKQIFELILTKYVDEEKKREDINKALSNAVCWGGWKNQELLIKYLFENYFTYIDFNKESSLNKRILLIQALIVNRANKVDQEKSLKLFKYILSKYEDKEQKIEHINKAFKFAIQEGWEYQELSIKYLTENYHDIILPNMNSCDWYMYGKKYILYLLTNYPNINLHNISKLPNKLLLGAMSEVTSRVTLHSLKAWFNVTD